MSSDIYLRSPLTRSTCWNGATSQAGYQQYLICRDCELLTAVFIFLGLATILSGAATAIAALWTFTVYCYKQLRAAIGHRTEAVLTSSSPIVALLLHSAFDSHGCRLHGGPFTFRGCSLDHRMTTSVRVPSLRRLTSCAFVPLDDRCLARVRRRHKIASPGVEDRTRSSSTRPEVRCVGARSDELRRKPSSSQIPADLGLINTRSHGSQKGSAAREKDGFSRLGCGDPGEPARHDNKRKRPRRHHNRGDDGSDQSDSSDNETPKRPKDDDARDGSVPSQSGPFMGRDWHSDGHLTYPCPFALFDPEHYAHFNGACTKISGSDPAKIGASHLIRFHVPPHRCPVCKNVLSSKKNHLERIDAWQEHLAKEKCLDEEKDYFHRYMSKQQYQNVCGKKKRGTLDGSTLQAKWEDLWKGLFGESPLIPFHIQVSVINPELTQRGTQVHQRKIIPNLAAETPNTDNTIFSKPERPHSTRRTSVSSGQLRGIKPLGDRFKEAEGLRSSTLLTSTRPEASTVVGNTAANPTETASTQAEVRPTYGNDSTQFALHQQPVPNRKHASLASDLQRHSKGPAPWTHTAMQVDQSGKYVNPRDTYYGAHVYGERHTDSFHQGTEIFDQESLRVVDEDGLDPDFETSDN